MAEPRADDVTLQVDGKEVTVPKGTLIIRAAEQLGISRPTLMKLIRDGELPAHKVGTHHRVKTADVLAHRRARLERQRSALDELRALEDELDTI